MDMGKGTGVVRMLSLLSPSREMVMWAEKGVKSHLKKKGTP